MNRITKGREQIINKTFVKMMDELGYDVELTYMKNSCFFGRGANEVGGQLSSVGDTHGRGF